MEEIQKQINAFLERAEIIKADMRMHVPGALIVNQVNQSLIFVSPKGSYIYEMDYVDNFVNRAAGIPEGQLLWQDYLLKSTRECRREEDPELFLEILKLSMKTTQHKAFDIYADGKHLKRVLTWRRALNVVYALKRICKDPMDLRYRSFRYIKKIWIVDSAGNTTYFIFDPKDAVYNPC